jgi:hypothetical protein
MAALNPLDEIDRAEITAALDRADHFITSLFLGRGKFEKHRLENLDHARRAGTWLQDKHKNGRLAMVYVITTEGRSVFVPPSFEVVP